MIGWLKALTFVAFVGVLIVGTLENSTAWVLSGSTGIMYMGLFVD